MATWRLDLQYDGTGFHGWARQPGLRTVQEEIERALRTLFGEAVRVRVAGRTDAGVHAWGQVASFETDAAVDRDRALLALNALLPDDVAVRSVGRAPTGFSARAAASRTYRYHLWVGTPRPVRERRYVWHVRGALEAGALEAVAPGLVGSRDWSACTSSADAYHTCVREVLAAGWRRFDRSDREREVPEEAAEATAAAEAKTTSAAHAVQDGRSSDDRRLGVDRYVFEITATGFVHNMVRVLVGTMVDAAQGRVTVAQVEAALASGERRRMGQTAPARGLALVRVGYPPGSGEADAGVSS